MVHAKVACFLALVAPASAGGHPIITRGIVGQHRQTKLLQSWSKELDSNKAGTTPVTRVVNLLKEMQTTLKTEMEEDEDLYEKLECWCNTGKYEKTEAIAAGKAKIDQLTAENEQGFARSAELKEQIKELEAQVADDKAALKTATVKREQEKEVFEQMENDSIQAIENMKSALEVLSRHSGAFPQLNAMSLLALSSSDEPLSDHQAERSLESWMQESGNVGGVNTESIDAAASKFLQSSDSKPRAAAPGWSADEMAIVKKALKTASALAQTRSREGYYPAYESQSGAIIGVLKQMEETMQADLAAAQKKEAAAAAAFADMRTAKTEAIEAGWKMSEQKEDELAKVDNNSAEAREDLAQTQETLEADETFLKNLEKMCADGDEAFEKRKASRLEEIKAVAETIEILTGDEARDAMSGTYNFLQVSESQASRKEAAAVLRKIALKTHNVDISFLANKVELDAFTKVKKAIDDMIAMLKTEQKDEVKKNDYCKDELQSTEMSIAKADDQSADLQAKIGSLQSDEVRLQDEIEAAKAAIGQAQIDLQRASEDRQKENLDFQKTIADQTITIEILLKAMERLAQFYDAQFLQKSATGHKGKQTPPVQQMEYKPNAGASGVMSMIEKLIYDAKDLVKDSKAAESESQAAYEQLVTDTNQSIADLAAQVVEKTAAKAKAHKDRLGAESDLMDTVDELEGLHKYEADVHEECDYVLKNFATRQQARGEEIEALQQAKQILDGANLR